MNKDYYPDSEPKRCWHCRCKKLTEKVTDSLDGRIDLEKEIICDSCGKTVSYWAFGYYCPPHYTGL